MNIFVWILTCSILSFWSPCRAYSLYGDPEDIKWSETCIKEILKNYKGPALNADNFPDESIKLNFSFYPGGIVKWVHLDSRGEKDEPSARKRQAIAGLKAAIYAASPLPVNERFVQTRRMTGFLDYSNYKRHEIVFHLNDYAGFWTARINRKETVSDKLKAVLKEISKKPPVLNHNSMVYAAVWFYILPDGSVEGILPVRCTSEKTRRKENFSHLSQLQKKMVLSLKGLDRKAIKQIVGDTDTPTGAILVYRSYQQPHLSIHEYHSDRNPDAVLLYD